MHLNPSPSAHKSSARASAAALCLGIGLGIFQPLQAAPITIGQGLELSQIDLAFPGVTAQPGSQYGLAAVNVSQVLSAAGMPSGGFLNISSPQGWVVRNLPVDPGMVAAGYAGLSMMFDLGASPGRITTLNVAVDVSAVPVTAFAALAGTPFRLGQLEINAQGGVNALSDTRSGPTDHRITGVNFAAGGPTFSIWQPQHSSVEQAINQCGPASLANSFQYLESRYGLVGSQPHIDIPGENGNPPQSRVAQFDLATQRQVGSGISEAQFFNGKTRYISDNKLTGALVVKSYGKSSGDQVLNGVAIDDQTDGGLELADWLLGELQHGEDVELWLDWKGGGAHLVDLIGGGKTNGTPWFAWVHDFKQGDNSKGTAYSEGGLGISYYDKTTKCWTNYVGSGTGVQPISDACFRFAASESVPEPTSISMLGLALTLLAVASRTRKNDVHEEPTRQG